jgi:hydroxymethylbilane synthase
MSSIRSLVIGSRGSKLALWQSQWVKSTLEDSIPGLEVTIEIIRTTGDEVLGRPLPEIGGKGVFTRELEESLLDGKIDLAVHSLKDLPTTLPDELEIAAITKREDPRDALLLNASLRAAVHGIAHLPERARVGTSSLRRASQLRHLRPDIEIVDLRGNVDTRLRKLKSGDYHAIILAVAGLSRLGLAERIDSIIDPSEILPAVGQGALGVEARKGDTRVRELLAVLDDRPTRLATEAERAVLASLGGGCAVPIAAYARIERSDRGEQLLLEAVVAEVTGRRLLRRQIDGAPEAGAQLGRSLAETMLALGAREMLGELRIGS